MARILLLDGFFLLHRANISFGKTDPNKPNYQLVFNFFRSLRVLIEQFDPERVYFCLEGSQVFRYQLFADYKAHRIVKTAAKTVEQQEDFNRQAVIALQLLKKLPIVQVLAEQYEADDVIGTLAEDLTGEEVIIVSGDSDFLQLLQKGHHSVQLYNPIKKEFRSAPAYHYLAFKALKGDPSDNIPGLMSEKEAERLVQNPSALEHFLAQPEQAANFAFNRKLIEICIVPADELIFQDDYQVDFDSLYREFERMEFSSMLTDKYWSVFQKTFQKLGGDIN